MEKKYLGKITHVSFGLGGYQDIKRSKDSGPRGI